MDTFRSHITKKIYKREFDLLHPLKSKRIDVRQATVKDVDQACALAKDNIPNSTADADIFIKIISHNSENILVFTNNKAITGICAMLMLTPLGLERLLLGEFNAENPDLLCLTKTGEKPAAIYMWGVVAPGLAADGIRQVSQILQQPKYRNINFFSRPNTEAGVRININLGFQPVKNTIDGLFRYIRLVNRDPKMQQAA